MICIFPDPYPDELLYSVCARYNAVMRYPNGVTATRDFFGRGGIAAVVDLPNRLDHLVAALPLGHLYSVADLIHRHTHYSFYAPFLPSDRAALVINAMRESGHNRVARHIGLSADRLKMPTHLRFCPRCVEQDRSNFGETYWHRAHQIPCVEVCPQHAVFLELSNTLWRNSKNPSEACSAEPSVHNSSARALDTSEHIHSIQLTIARYARWILDRSVKIVGGQALRLRYHNLLLRRGLAYYNGQVRTAELIRKVLDYFPSELLSQLGCEINNPYSNWLLRLLHTHKAEVAQHPVRHILFLISMNCAPEEVFDSFNEFKPFGDEPWPCLNHASDHYSEKRVRSCAIADGEKKNKGKPKGTFSCTCGFVYIRTGPDESAEDRFKWTSVQSYGSTWEDQLKQLWEDTSLTLRQIALKLGVCELTAKRRAISLGLTFPRQTPGSLRSSGKVLDRYKIKRKPPLELQTMKRQDLLSLINERPQANRTELQVFAPNLIDWQRRYDREWLDTSLPPAKLKKPPRTTVNWNEQDPILAKEVEKAATHIRSVNDPPKRVSITAVINIVGCRPWLEKGLNKLPLTSKALDTHLEAFEAYVIRRIAWAAETLRNEGVTTSRATLSNQAGLRGRLISKNERVQRALDVELSV